MTKTINLNKIKLLLEQLAECESQEKQIHDLAENAISGNSKSFNVKIESNSLSSKKNKSTSVKFVIPSILDMMKNDMKSGIGLRPIWNVKDIKKQEFILEIGDSECLKFLEMCMVVIAERKRKTITALRRLGIKL